MKAKREFFHEPDYAVPPGETIREQMEFYGWSQQELAIRLETTPQTINRIFKGDQPITLETANKLERVLGAPARFWNNLELNYREGLTKQKDRDRLQADLDWLKQIPVAELCKRNAIPKASVPVEQLANVLAFYGVGSVKAWRDLWENPAVAARRSACFETQAGPASAWIRLGELAAHAIPCEPFCRDRLLDTLPDLRRLTTSADPGKMVKDMQARCAACGVALALVPEMKKVPWNGATRWLTPDKVMVLLNLRGKGEDRFWFSFFHELGHVLHDSKRDLLINDGTQDDPREAHADAFAAETLIPSDQDERVEALRTSGDVQALARELGISPGIVVGRYHFLTQNWTRFKPLIRKFTWGKRP